MYYVYADDDLIYNQFDRSLTIHSPKVSLELGKAGSFQFDIPPTNQYYNSLTQLKTIIKVELDNRTVFYGRVFSITRNFNNIKHVYCEGALSFLIDTLQQAKSYKGKAKQLFRDIISSHNQLVQSWQSDVDKKFVIDRLEIEDTDVIIPGKKDKDGNYYGDEYEQTIIESIAEEWLTTYDYINNVLIEYLGGYLMYEYDSKNKRNKISYVSENSFDDEIEEATRNNLSAPEIDYGVNMLDLTEELNAEDLCTVLIPLGDDGLTIEKATNKASHSDVRVEYIDGKGIGISDIAASEKYGKIVKSYVFDNVNEADTLFTNGYKYLKAHKNIPISFTVKAVDMHFVDSSQQIISVGELAKLNSTPHNLVQYLICTKVEYDLEDASKNQYTFGNPKQSMTERYKKNKEKEKQRQNANNRKGAGTALATAADIAQMYAKEVSDNYANIKTWVEDHYAGIEEAVHFVSDNGEGFVRSTKWVDEYGANAEEVLTWHGKYAESAVSTIKWATDYSAGIEDTVSWKTANAEGLVSAKKWVDDNSAGIEDTVSWKGKNANGLLSTKKWVDDNSAGIEDTVSWKGQYASGLVSSKKWIDNYSAGIADAIKWKSQYASGLVSSKKWIDNYSAGIADAIKWKSQYASGLVTSKKWIDNYSAGIADAIKWKGTNGSGLVSTMKWVDDNKSAIESTVTWKANNSSAVSSISGISNTATAAHAMASLFATYKGNTAKVELSSGAKSEIKLIADNVFATNLTADAILTKAFNANDKVYIGPNAMAMTTNLIQTANESCYIQARNIYKGTKIGDAYKVLSKGEINTYVAGKNGLIASTVDASFISKALRGNYANFTRWIVDGILTGENLHDISSIKTKALYIYNTDGKTSTSLKDYIDARINEVVTSSYIGSNITQTAIKDKLKENSGYKTFDGYLAETVLANINTKTIQCNGVEIPFSAGGKNLGFKSVKEIMDYKIEHHKHSSGTITVPSLSPTSKSANQPYGNHYHSFSLKIGDTTYNVNTTSVSALTPKSGDKWAVAGATTTGNTGGGTLT